jgi:hypothetical protein
MEFYGTHGQITLDEVRDFIRISEFGKDEVTLKISDLAHTNMTHGGGDFSLVQTLYDILTDKASNETALVHSVESHLMGIFAEQSRKEGGTLKKVH